MSNLNQIISKMKNLNLEAHHEQYIELIDTCGDSENKHLVFRVVSSAPGSLSTKLFLIYSLVSKLKKKYDHKLVQDVLEYLKTHTKSSSTKLSSTKSNTVVTETTPEDYEWITKIIFMIIENIRDKKKNDEIKLLVMETLQRCTQEIDIMPFLFNFMLSDNCWEIVYALLVFMPDLCDSFVRNAIQQTNVNILKNISHILSTLSTNHKSLFINYKHFDSFLDSEHYFLRNCYLDIISNLVPVFKESNEIKEIEIIIGILEERLNDVYFNVRYKVLNLLGNLFQENSIPMNIRNSVIRGIGERVLDKTIIVRKRAVTICSLILMNHPFKSEGSLKRRECLDEVRDYSDGVGKVRDSNGGMVNKPRNSIDKPRNSIDKTRNSIGRDSISIRDSVSIRDSISNTPFNYNSTYYNDLNDFHDVIFDILKKIVLYLESRTTGDLHVFIEFIKLCLYYEIEGSKEAFEMIFDFIFEGEEETISTCFSDIIIRLKMRKISPYAFLKQFVNKSNPAFEKILRILWRKKILDNEFYKMLIDEYLKGVDPYECAYLIRHIPKIIEEEKFYNLLKFTTEKLFSVQDSQELIKGLSVYCQVLRMNVLIGSKDNVNSKDRDSKDNVNSKDSKVNVNSKDSKVNVNSKDSKVNVNSKDSKVETNINSKVINLISKNLTKMVFFDYQTVQVTIQSLYSLSKDPQESVSSLLTMLSTKNVNSLKLLYAVGCIGVIHLEYLERLERIAKKKKTKMDTVIPTEIRERRKSINASRLSLNDTIMSNINSSMIEGRRGDNLSMLSNMDVNNVDSEYQTISDFFFFLKEKDLLYNKDSLLYGYSKDISKYCKDRNESIQEVAYLTLFKLMCLSSEYFQEHRSLFLSSFTHPNYKIRSNALIAMGDFLLYYNSLAEDMSFLLFESLRDSNLTVKKNGLLTIFILLKRNILRISNNSTALSKLIFDENEEIRNITKTIIRTLGDNENFISIMFYERLTTEKEEYKTFVDLFIPLLKDKTKEMVYAKLLRANLDQEVLNYLSGKCNFNNSEKVMNSVISNVE